MSATRTHRDTIAFVLAILGASLWALFPMANLLHRHTTADLVVRPLLVAMAGASIGAWTAATVWPRVALATPAVAGGLVGAFVVGVVDLRLGGAVSVAPIEALLVVGVAASAVSGAAIGRRMRTACVSLVAAWITLGSLGLVLLGAWGAQGLGYRYSDDAVALLVVFGPMPGAFAAMVLCEDVHRRSVVMWLAVLALSSFVGAMLARQTLEADRAEALMAGSLGGAVLAGNAALAHWIVCSLLWRRRSDKDLPTAQVVDR